MKDFFQSIENFGKDINALTKEKTTRLSVFYFRAFLNVGMLLSESERAKNFRTSLFPGHRIKGRTKKIAYNIKENI